MKIQIMAMWRVTGLALAAHAAGLTMGLTIGLAPTPALGQSAMSTSTSIATAELQGFSIRNTRITVKDPQSTAKFYEAAFGLKEVMRIESPRYLVLLGFGTTLEEARRNKGARILLDKADPGWSPDAIAHVVLNVPDTYEAVKRVKAVGGEVVREPVATTRPDLTRVVAYVKDPDGNLLELLAER